MVVHAKFASSDSPIVFLSSLLHLTLSEFFEKDEVEVRNVSKKRSFQGKIRLIFS